MPLLSGKKNIGRNIKELEEHGSRPRSRKQILAIALSKAGEATKPGAKLKRAGMKHMMSKRQMMKHGKMD